MPTDAELAAARLTAAALAVALAVRVLEADDAGRPTVQRVMDLTGYSRSAVYNARAELRRHWPAEYPAPHGSGTADSATLDGPVERTTPGQTVVARLKAPAVLAGLNLDAGAPVLVTAPAVQVWQSALAAAAGTMDGARSWDTYDVYSAAWDQVLAVVPPDRDPFPEVIALAVDYAERMTGETVDRKKIALLIRQFGKAGLYGLSKALGVTDQDTDRDRYRYARAVAARVVDDLHQEPA